MIHRLATATLFLAVAVAAPAAPAAGQAHDARPDTAIASDTTGPEPTVLGTVKYFAVAVLTDAWASTTGLLRVRGDEALIAAGVIGVGVALYAYDVPVLEAALRNRDAPVFRTMEDAALALEPLALMSQTAKYYAVALVAGNVLDHATGHDRTRHIFEELLLSHWIGTTLRKGVGYTLGRRRPDQERGAYYYSFWGGSSFPSGHASTAAQVAAVVSHHVDWWPVSVLAYGWAASIAYERVVSSNHWPSDAWIGAFWGWGVAQVVIRRREADRQDFEPIFSPADGTVGLRLRLGMPPAPPRSVPSTPPSP